MSTSRNARLNPAELATALDLWALRREKILALLDVRAARRARKLACTCRLLARPITLSTLGEHDWQGEWRRTREQVLETLVEARPMPVVHDSDPEGDRDTCPGFFGDSLDSLDVTEHDAPTRAVDWSEVELTDGDRPTRIVEIRWPDEAKVA